MTRLLRTPGRFLGTAAALSLSALACCAGASAASSAGLPPVCPATSAAQPSGYGARCYVPSWKTDSYATQLIKTGLSVSQKTTGKGEYADDTITIKVGFSIALKLCPGGAVPNGDIPCSGPDAPSAAVSELWNPRTKQLSAFPVGFGGGEGICPQGATAGTCTWTTKLGEASMHGPQVWMMGVTMSELTLSPTNDLASSGFTVPVAFTIPTPAKTKKPKA